MRVAPPRSYTGYSGSDSPGEGTRADPPMERAGRRDNRVNRGTKCGRAETTEVAMERAPWVRRVRRVDGAGGCGGGGGGDGGCDSGDNDSGGGGSDG